MPATNNFDCLIDEMNASEERRAARWRMPPAPPAPAVPTPSQYFSIPTGAASMCTLAKAIDDANENSAAARLDGIRPGAGVRIDGRPGGFQVVAIETSGKVRVRQVRDKSARPGGTNFDDGVVTLVDNAALTADRRFDAPAMPTFAKALGNVETRVAAVRKRSAAKDMMAAKIAEIRQRAIEGVRAGTITAHEAAKLDAIMGRMAG